MDHLTALVQTIQCPHPTLQTPGPLVGGLVEGEGPVLPAAEGEGGHTAVGLQEPGVGRRLGQGTVLVNIHLP